MERQNEPGSCRSRTRAYQIRLLSVLAVLFVGHAPEGRGFVKTVEAGKVSTLGRFESVVELGEGIGAVGRQPVPQLGINIFDMNGLVGVVKPVESALVAAVLVDEHGTCRGDDQPQRQTRFVERLVEVSGRQRVNLLTSHFDLPLDTHHAVARDLRNIPVTDSRAEVLVLLEIDLIAVVHVDKALDRLEVLRAAIDAFGRDKFFVNLLVTLIDHAAQFDGFRRTEGDRLYGEAEDVILLQVHHMDHQIVVVVVALVGVLETDHLKHLRLVAFERGVFVRRHELDGQALLRCAGLTHTGHPDGHRAVSLGKRHAVGLDKGYVAGFHGDFKGLGRLEMAEIDIDGRLFGGFTLGFVYAGNRQGSQHNKQELFHTIENSEMG